MFAENGGNCYSASVVMSGVDLSSSKENLDDWNVLNYILSWFTLGVFDLDLVLKL